MTLKTVRWKVTLTAVAGGSFFGLFGAMLWFSGTNRSVGGLGMGAAVLALGVMLLEWVHPTTVIISGDGLVIRSALGRKASIQLSEVEGFSEQPMGALLRVCAFRSRAYPLGALPMNLPILPGDLAWALNRRREALLGDRPSVAAE
ncbi:MAG: hypothetical protein V4514_15545 [Pseudomonadota bacterium]|uniref:hypothetical protein n=1 Tax=Phenylobacterium sp. TaxID=1871053 RepID=UPI0025DE80E2|nr:hypothetical protein [Phenylobacterium sp.]MBT9471245.1 hypothetical protein [Phenylobacterium sp.]